VSDFPLTLVVGFLAGFFGAMPPGPLNVTIFRKTLHGFHREAYRVALGGAVVDAFICGALGVGLGWLLERVATNRWVKGSLALFLMAYGLKLLIWDRKKDAEDEARLSADKWSSGERPAVAASPEAPRRFRMSVIVGFLQGAANPTLIVNWTIVIGFLVGHRLVTPGPGVAAAFALGVGLGVFVWFTAVIEVLDKLKERARGWVRRSTLVAGALLVLFGLVFAWKSFFTTA
jgi:threonine/homoserine/homoserine lactone efflux protein